MKRLFFSVIFLLSALCGRAQQSTPKSEWLTSFSAVELDGPMRVTFVQVPDSTAPKIVYDTQGAYTSKFRYEIRDDVLKVYEKNDSRRPSLTEVTICYNAMDRVATRQAEVAFEGVFRGGAVDVTVGGGGRATIPCAVADLLLDVSGDSEVTLTGEVRYLTAEVSTGKVDALQLSCVSARVSASNKARVEVTASDRFEGKASTSATIRYAGEPKIVRTFSRFMAGNIEPVK